MQTGVISKKSDLKRMADFRHVIYIQKEQKGS